MKSVLMVSHTLAVSVGLLSSTCFFYFRIWIQCNLTLWLCLNKYRLYQTHQHPHMQFNIIFVLLSNSSELSSRKVESQSFCWYNMFPHSVNERVIWMKSFTCRSNDISQSDLTCFLPHMWSECVLFFISFSEQNSTECVPWQKTLVFFSSLLFSY